MYKVHSPNDVNKLRHLQNKKNILVRFMMNGCPGCMYSQGDWDAACKRATLSPDDAILELESNFVEQFKDTMKHRTTDLDIYKFPTIMMIRGSSVSELQNRDTASILKMLKTVKKTKQMKKKRRKTKRF
jgi:hypothetical protein